MPEAFMTYKSAIQLFKLYNSDDHTLEWVSLNVNQIITTRQSNFIFMKTNRTKVGLNILSNRLHVLNGMIPLTWLNQYIQNQLQTSTTGYLRGPALKYSKILRDCPELSVYWINLMPVTIFLPRYAWPQII